MGMRHFCCLNVKCLEGILISIGLPCNSSKTSSFQAKADLRKNICEVTFIFNNRLSRDVARGEQGERPPPPETPENLQRMGNNPRLSQRIMRIDRRKNSNICYSFPNIY